MRALLYAFQLPAWALLAASLTACCVAAPEAEDWLAVGFQTPEQTFRTFQTGLRAELPDLEYLCLGSAFKQRTGASLLGYLQFRREQPWLKFAAKAKVKEVHELADGHVRLVAEVDTWFIDETFALDLVREDFWELWVGGKRVADDAAEWRRLSRERDGSLVVTVPLPDGLGVAEIGELRAGREWKIDGFSRLDGSAGGAP
jgi:hypothetical protein